jgi:hypothetical protein
MHIKQEEYSGLHYIFCFLIWLPTKLHKMRMKKLDFFLRCHGIRYALGRYIFYLKKKKQNKNTEKYWIEVYEVNLLQSHKIELLKKCTYIQRTLRYTKI